MDQFDLASPHYREGEIKKKHPLVVEWHDGSKEVLQSRIAANFHAFEVGDQFSAYVKLGVNNVALGVERLEKLTI